MNKVLFFFIGLAGLSFAVAGQKPLISINGEFWEGYGFHQISNNGQYVACNIDEGTGSLYIRSTRSAWQISVPRARLISLTQDSRRVIFKSGDSVGVMDLDGLHEVEYLKDIATCRVVKRDRDHDLLFYSVKDFPERLVIREIETAEEKSYAKVDNYWTSDDGNIVVLEMLGKDGGTAGCTLNWLNIREQEMRTIWQGKKINGLKIGHKDEQCTFMAGAAADRDNNSIWLYRHTDRKVTKVLDCQSKSLKGLVIGSIIAFNDVSNRIFLELGQPEIHQATDAGMVSVDVWSYKDTVLQSAQLAKLKNHENMYYYEAVVNVTDQQLIRLEYDHETISSTVYDDKVTHYLLLRKNAGGDSHESNWNRASYTSMYLVDLDNGNRRLISMNNGADEYEFDTFILSYNEHYVFYYNRELKGYCSYNISDGLRRNMTISIGRLYKIKAPGDDSKSISDIYVAAALIKNSDALLVYSQHDVIKLDPGSHTPAMNLTGVSFQRRDWNCRLAGQYTFGVIDNKKPLCLRIINETNKECSLTSISIESVLAVPRFRFEPYWMDSAPWEKARDSSVYMVERMSAEEHPNLFFTRDFKLYNAITHICPEKAYNWMKSELVTWKTFDGDLCQGVLYKPQNFDPRLKYPMLVYYYEKMSARLHQFLTPDVSNGELNIPYYVSHGYLVFTPDIHYKIGWPGRSAYNCVVSGAEYLARRGYVDGKRMGLQGHSFGGFETNYIITHTALFAAAMSASGISDILSDYNSVMQSGDSRQYFYELTQMRIWSTLWKKPNLYFENSAVLHADKIATPLMIMANKADDVVPYEQGVELFTALRRLGKKVWMLQYDGEGHGIYSRQAQEDFTLRMAQFFDYYLKGKQPPRWMMVGVPANLKGIDLGLGIDSSGETP